MEGSASSPVGRGESAEQDTLELQLSKQFDQLISKHPSLNIDQAFYLEASRLYQQLLQRQQEVLVLKQQVEELQLELGIQIGEKKRVSQAENHSAPGEGSERKKRVRRTAVEIARHYVCTIDRCNKSYGSEGSLNQHIKIKHKSHYTKHMFMMDFHPSH